MNNTYEVVPEQDEATLIATYRFVKKYRLMIGQTCIVPGVLTVVGNLGTTFANGVWITIGCVLLIIGGLIAIWDYRMNGIDGKDTLN